MSKIINFSKQKDEACGLPEILTKLMQERNVNATQLGKNTGLSITTIQRICTDPSCNPTLSSVVAIADFFGLSPDQLIGKEPLPQDLPSYHPNFDAWLSVPILSLEQVVHWPGNIEEIKHDQDIKCVRTDLDINEQVFAVLAIGEALEPKFSEGTILVFDPKKPFKNKDLVLIKLEDKVLPQFRQLIIDGSDLYIRTINPELAEFRPALLKRGEYKILGTLIQAKVNYI